MMTLHEMEIKESEKYHLAEAECNGKGIALLTRDNVAKIEAIISLDSNYRNTSNENRKPVVKKNGEYKYIGSISYWIKELSTLSKGNAITDDGHDYSHTIEFLINAIDNENSTHLNSDKIGRKVVRKRIIAEYPSLDLLIEALQNKDSQYSLLKLIATPKAANEKKHFSFATKFCHYCALYLFAGTEQEDMYSIYDEVLKKALPLYIDYYLSKSVKPKEYENNYESYIGYIDMVRGVAEKQYGEIISRNGFDHLVWYSYKGRQDWQKQM